MTTEPVCVERRVGQRFELHVPVSVKLTDRPHETCGLTQDLSARGSFFFTDFPLTVGERIELTLLMPSEITLGDSMRVRCMGTVLRVVQPTIGTKLGVAVHFANYEYLPDGTSSGDAVDSFDRISALHSHTGKEEPHPVGAMSRRSTVS